jgi:hypothetical protein
MIWLLLIILLIVIISLASKGKKKTKLEIQKLEKELTETKNEKPVGVSDELIKLKSLLDQNIISQQEYEDQKKKLLS